MKLIYLKSAWKSGSFDVSFSIKIPFFRVSFTIEPVRSLLQFVTTNCLIGFKYILQKPGESFNDWLCVEAKSLTILTTWSCRAKLLLLRALLLFLEWKALLKKESWVAAVSNWSKTKIDSFLTYAMTSLSHGRKSPWILNRKCTAHKSNRYFHDITPITQAVHPLTHCKTGFFR